MSQHRNLAEIAAHLRRLLLSAAVPAPGAPCPLPDDEFNALALEIFSAQFEANPVYRSLCTARGITPNDVKIWSAIPAVPAAGFKEFEVTCLPETERMVQFHSSGTTGHKPSRHFHSRESLALYEASLWPWFRKNLISHRSPDSTPELLVLTPSPEHAPNSSLVHMFETVRKQLGAPSSVFLGTATSNGWGLDCERVLTQLNSVSERHAQGPSRPVLLLGTAIALLDLLEFMLAKKHSIRLPPGSRVMETGGYKGRSRAVSGAQLHSMLSRQLGIPSAFVISEYGMSELSSQAYATWSGPVRVNARSEDNRASTPPRVEPAGRQQPARHRYQFPPWARVRIISPETGAEAAEGETGLLQVFDLANVFSVMAIQTEDLAAKNGSRFELLGRASDAEPRGCSLRVVSSP